MITVQLPLGEWAARLVELKLEADALRDAGELDAGVTEAAYQQWLRWGQKSHAFEPKGDYMVLLKRLTELQEAINTDSRTGRLDLVVDHMAAKNLVLATLNNL